MTTDSDVTSSYVYGMASESNVQLTSQKAAWITAMHAKQSCTERQCGAGSRRL